MPWKEQTIEMERREFVERALSGMESKSSLCREYGISRPTGDKWIKRALAGETLRDRDKTPLHQPQRIDPEVEAKIVACRKEHSFLGARKIHKVLESQGEIDLPCHSTINAVLHRHGLITPEASQMATPYKRFEMPEPNDMWQADYKGHFPMRNGQECHPLNILDDCSRFCLCSRAMPDETFATFQPVLIELFHEFGMPKYFLSDNGNPWGNGQRQGYSRVDVWLMQLGILPIHSRLHHPQTQGKDESFNRSMTRELLRNVIFDDIKDGQEQLSKYRKFYNEERPHHALKLETPASRYHRSPREYTGFVTEWEYPAQRKIIRVHGKGHFRWGGHDYYLGEAFSQETVALRKSHREGYLTIEYREFRVGRINLQEQNIENKRAYLLNGDPRSK